MAMSSASRIGCHHTAMFAIWPARTLPGPPWRDRRAVGVTNDTIPPVGLVLIQRSVRLPDELVERLAIAPAFGHTEAGGERDADTPVADHGLLDPLPQSFGQNGG